MVAQRGAANEISQQVGTAKCLAVVGSSSFWYPDCFETCQRIGRKLNELDSLSTVTAGMQGARGTELSKSRHMKEPIR